MADDMFDDFDEFDDTEFDMNSMGDEPVDGRDTTTSIANSAITGFTEEFTDDKIDTIGAISKKIGLGIAGDSGSELEKGLDTGMEQLNKTAEELRSASRPFLKSLASKVPKGGVLEKIHSKLLGLSDDLEKTRSNQDSEDSRVTEEVNRLIGEKETIERREEKVKEAYNKAISQTSLGATNKVAGFSRAIYDFHNDITSSYYRKSLELKIRILSRATESLELSKSTNEIVIKQLEGIVRNTALPDFIKLKGMEGLKSKLKSDLNEKTVGKLLGQGSMGEVIGKNLSKKIKSYGDTAINLMGVSTDQLEQSADMEEMGVKTDYMAMAGGMGAGGAKDKIARMLANKLRKSKLTSGYASKIQEYLDDPASALDGVDSKSKFKGIAKFLKPMLSGESIKDNRSLEADNLDEVGVFSNREKQSINMVIPGYLAKIEAGIRSLRSKREESILSYDRKDDTFITAKDVGDRLKADMKKDNVLSGTSEGINSIVKSILDSVGDETKPLGARDITDLKNRLYDFAMSDKSLSALNLTKNGFYDGLSIRVASTFKEGLRNYLHPKDDETGVRSDTIDIDKKDNFNRSFTRVRTGVSDPSALIEESMRNGNIEALKEQGLVKYDEKLGKYVIQMDNYHKAQKRINASSTGIDFNARKEYEEQPDKEAEANIKEFKSFVSNSFENSKSFASKKKEQYLGTDEEIESYLDKHFGYKDKKKKFNKNKKKAIVKLLKGYSDIQDPKKRAEYLKKLKATELKDIEELIGNGADLAKRGYGKTKEAAVSGYAMGKDKATEFGNMSTGEMRKKGKDAFNDLGEQVSTLVNEKTGGSVGKDTSSFFSALKDNIGKFAKGSKLESAYNDYTKTNNFNVAHNPLSPTQQGPQQLSSFAVARSAADTVSLTKLEMEKNRLANEAMKLKDKATGVTREDISKGTQKQYNKNKVRLLKKMEAMKAELGGGYDDYMDQSKDTGLDDSVFNMVKKGARGTKKKFEDMKAMDRKETQVTVEEAVVRALDKTGMGGIASSLFKRAKSAFDMNGEKPSGSKTSAFDERNTSEKEEKDEDRKEETLDTLKKIEENLAPKKEKKKERKNSWKNLLKKKEKKEKEDEDTFIKAETKKPKSLLGLLLGLGGSAIMGSFKGAFTVLKAIPKVIESTWSILKFLGKGAGVITSALGAVTTGLMGTAKFLKNMLFNGPIESFKMLKKGASSIVGMLSGFGKGIMSKTKGLLGIGTKTAGKTAAKAGVKFAGKSMAKTVGKSLLKKIPGIGLLMGLGFAANDALAGDWKGAGVEALSGLASTIPFVGTAASAALDLFKDDITGSKDKTGLDASVKTTTEEDMADISSYEKKELASTDEQEELSPTDVKQARRQPLRDTSKKEMSKPTFNRKLFDNLVNDGLDNKLPEDHIEPIIFDKKTSIRYKSLSVDAKKFYIGFSRYMYARGIKIKIPAYGANRDLVDQAYLYSIGRTIPGDKVTWTKDKSKFIGGTAIKIISLKGPRSARENFKIANDMRNFARLNKEHKVSFMRISKDPNYVQMDKAKAVKPFSVETHLKEIAKGDASKAIDKKLNKDVLSAKGNKQTKVNEIGGKVDSLVVSERDNEEVTSSPSGSSLENIMNEMSVAGTNSTSRRDAPVKKQISDIVVKADREALRLSMTANNYLKTITEQNATIIGLLSEPIVVREGLNDEKKTITSTKSNRTLDNTRSRIELRRGL